METLRLIYRKVQNAVLLKNKYINIVLKVAIIVGIGYSLYHRISGEENLDVMLDNVLGYLVFPNLFFLIGAALLMPLMWWAESYRWLVLVRRVVPPSSATLKKSFEAMISGQTLGMFVPYRIGKIGGRIIIYESKKKLELLIINHFDGESIKLLTDIYGAAGATFVLYAFLDWQPWVLTLLGILTLAIIVLRIYLFYNIKVLIDWLARFKIRKGIIKKARILEAFTTPELRKVMQASGFRIFLNFLQYYLLLRFFHIEVPFLEALFLISAIYYFIGNLPLPALAGLFARIQVALFIWQQYSDNIISMSSIPLVLWVLNSLLPALVGVYILMNTNLAKNIRAFKFD